MSEGFTLQVSYVASEGHGQKGIRENVWVAEHRHTAASGKLIIIGTIFEELAFS